MIPILLDENMPYDLIRLFEKYNFLVYHIKKLGKSGIKNGEVYLLSLELNAWIVTRDSDFDNIFMFQHYSPAGIIIVKSKITTISYLIDLFQTILEKKVIEFAKQQLIVLNEDGITVKNNP